jgi:glycosyltransferase involved in cell wall biosynthesis
MRVALVVHGLPPRERTGVETHVAALAKALGRAGAEVLVLAVRKDCDLPHLAERRERREGYNVDWLVVNEPPRDVLQQAVPPGVAEAVGNWLDREQPDVVHVHHLKGLGWKVLEEVRARGVPLVLTAHDAYAFCHRVAHLRPDLQRCAAIGDAQRCARCDLAVGALHGRTELGDWHMGVFPDEVDARAREALLCALEGNPGDLELTTCIELRRAADALRVRALQCADVVLAPTLHLLAKLARAGIERERMQLSPYGIETEDLAELPAPAREDGRPLRFGFLGGMSKHKGAHVLLEAFRGVHGAELDLFGDSTDRPYVERVRAQCAEIGARWNGAYEQRDLPAILARLDVVCVPSLWDENAPFVIREAFAAGRPVIASRTEALQESVRDGVDGLLVELGDADAWRNTLQRLSNDRELVRTLACGVRPPLSIQALARDLLALYGSLATQRSARESESGLPEHLWGFHSRRIALRRTPIDELYTRVRGGLERLRKRLSSETRAPSEAVDAALRRARDLLRDRERKAHWIQAVSADDRRARASLAAERSWLASELAERDRELAWRRASSDTREQAHGRELAGLREELAARQAEVLWLRELAVALEREREALEGQREASSRALDALARHEMWLREEARSLAAAVGAAEASAGVALDELPTLLAQARERATVLGVELEWRRAEMEQALGDGGRLVRTLVAQSALGRRLETWRGRAPGSQP